MVRLLLLVLQQACVLEEVLDALLFLLHYDSFFLAGTGDCDRDQAFGDDGVVSLLHLDWGTEIFLPVEGRGGVTLVAVDVSLAILLLLGLDVVGGLDGVVPALFALAFVEFAHSVDLPDDFSIDLDAFLGVEALFLEHGQIEHLVLDF